MKRPGAVDRSGRGGGGDPRRTTPWHAVSIVTANSCCSAASSLRGVRFLSADAPRLPLSQCNFNVDCLCSYKHHSDRRAAPRRRDDLMGLRRRGYTANERRADFGRREDD
jgi:hypothetical protein